MDADPRRALLLDQRRGERGMRVVELARDRDLQQPRRRDRVLDNADVLLADSLHRRERAEDRVGRRAASRLERASGARTQRRVGLVRAAEHERLRIGDGVDAEDRPVDHGQRPRSRDARGPRRPCAHRRRRGERPRAQRLRVSRLDGDLRRLARRDQRSRGDEDVRRCRRRAREDDLARRDAARPPRDPDERHDLVEIPAGRRREEAGLVDEVELPRDHRVLAREALAERAHDAAGIAVGEPRRRLRVRRALVARVEVAAPVRPRRACGRNVGRALPPDDRPGDDVEVGSRREAEVVAVDDARHAHRRRDRCGRVRELERLLLVEEHEALARDAAGQRADEVVDEDAVRLGGEAHEPTSSENGTTKFSGFGCPISCTVRSIWTVSRGGDDVAYTFAESTLSIRGSCFSASST